MSKKFKNKLCAYCRARPSTRSGDHVFAREFFLEEKRANLPKVPACERCNNEKSRFEHYLTAVLPFGGRHPDASVNLTEMVPDRLAKNVRLHRELTDGSERALLKAMPDEKFPALTVPFDGAILEGLFDFIVRGLAFYHWGVSLEDKHSVRVITLTEVGQEAFSLLFGMNAKKRISIDLGGGTFRYDGLQGDYPELTLWRFSVYGGLLMAGDPDASEEIATGIAAATANKEFLKRPAMTKIFGGA